MTTLFALLLPLAGCAAMILCSRMMRRAECATPSAADATEVVQLRAEVAELRSRLAPIAQPDRDEFPVR